MVSLVLSILVSLILLVIFIEYRNEKKYQEDRRQKNLKRTGKQTTSKKIPQEKVSIQVSTKEHTPVIVKENVPLPQANHPKFNHSRLVEMGLSDIEAKEFVSELIPQIETQIPLIKEAMLLPDFHQMERLTHNIKGSATNIGTGGVSDLLVEYNTYLKKGTNIAIAQAYLNHLQHYTNELKEQYA